MILPKAKMNDLLDLLAKDAKVLVPMNVNGSSKFAPWGSPGELDFAAVNTLLPPKDALFPQTEKMYQYKVNANAISAIEEVVDNDKQVVVGIRPCDMYSIGCMDDVFLTRTFVDDFYKRKRDNLLTVAIGCNQVRETCFCESMGLNPQKADNADVLLLDTGDAYNVVAQTEKGQEAVKSWQSLLAEGEGQVPAVACSLKVDMQEVPEKLLKMFEHPIWEEEGKTCIGCGTCTYVCPTCYCFDIDSKNAGNEGTKFRCWDSCMFSEYTRMAGGHNPRPSKKERVRNRFLHKLAFYQERYGKTLCAGCGRCVSKCPVHLDITRFIDKVKEVSLDG